VHSLIIVVAQSEAAWAMSDDHPKLWVDRELVRRIRSVGGFKDKKCDNWVGDTCRKGHRCKFYHGDGDPLWNWHIPHVSRHKTPSGEDKLVLRTPLPKALLKWMEQMGAHIFTLDNGRPQWID